MVGRAARHNHMFPWLALFYDAMAAIVKAE